MFRDCARILRASRTFDCELAKAFLAAGRRSWVKRWLCIEGLPDGVDVAEQGVAAGITVKPT